MKSVLDLYIEDIDNDVNHLERKLYDLESKLFKWGKESEIRMLKFLIAKKKELLEESRQYKLSLVSFKG